VTHGAQDASPRRILLVEDDAVAVHFAVQVLAARGGFDVVHTPDPAVALKRASSEHWDLVLTDVELPGMTGLELVRQLRLVAPDLPVAVMTAHDAADPAMRTLRGQADEFLQKPIRPAQLLATVTSLVARGRAARLAVGQAVLAIGAHPGDAEIGAAGALLTHRRTGDQISILSLSGGARGDAESTRGGESGLAALTLGAELYREHLPDNQIAAGDPTIGVIRRVLESVRPAVIYTHSLHDANSDHRSVHSAVMMAAREDTRVCCFQSPSGTVDFRPGHFVIIDGQMERKILAIRAFTSHAEVRSYLDRGLVTATASYWSRFGDGRYAEAFEVTRAGATAASHPDADPQIHGGTIAGGTVAGGGAPGATGL
jgi:CheY-like chemotaxis protein/LmbE family N-acetylglucosaminyl deacetylase